MGRTRDPSKPLPAYNSIAATDDVFWKLNKWQEELARRWGHTVTKSETLDWLLDSVGPPDAEPQEFGDVDTAPNDPRHVGQLIDHLAHLEDDQVAEIRAKLNEWEEARGGGSGEG